MGTRFLTRHRKLLCSAALSEAVVQIYISDEYKVQDVILRWRVLRYLYTSYDPRRDKV